MGLIVKVQLHHRVTGNGEPVILLHGLFGSLDNLNGVARRLAESRQVHALDLRNHGQSPHVSNMSYAAMAGDVLGYMDDQGLARAALLGHSMGGKTAMELALRHPDRVSRLIVADIAPVAYPRHHDSILAGLRAVTPSRIGSRREADAILADHVPELAVRQFLLKNLVRKGPDHFVWRMNLDVIERCYDRLVGGQDIDASYEGPVLFIKGGDSDYLQNRHRQTVERLFPRARLRVIPGTGHWLHAEKPDLFATLCERFLEGDMDTDRD